MPNTVTRYVLIVQYADGGEFNEAVPLWECFPGGVKALPLPVYRAQARLGRAIESQQTDTALQVRNQLVQFLRSELGGGTAVLLKEVFDPAKMYLDGIMRENRELLVVSF